MTLCFRASHLFTLASALVWLSVHLGLNMLFSPKIDTKINNDKIHKHLPTERQDEQKA